MIDICREMGHAPSWWETLSTDDRRDLLAFRLYQAEQAKRAGQ